MPVTSDKCIIGTKKYSNASILLNCYNDDCFQGYGQIKEAFRAATKDDILQPCITDDDLRSSKTGVVEVGYDLYVFAIRYQQVFTASQPIKVDFKFDGVVLDVIGYALVLKNELISISSDGQTIFWFDLSDI